MVPFERALVSSYRPSISFPLTRLPTCLNLGHRGRIEMRTVLMRDYHYLPSKLLPVLFVVRPYIDTTTIAVIVNNTTVTTPA